MRLTANVLSQYFKRYIERELHEGKLRRQWHPLTGWKEIKRKQFNYNEHRPWTDEFKAANRLGDVPKKIYVEPIKEWSVFKGDRVEVLVGHDKGKQGLINSIIKERNWVFVEGLNNKYRIETASSGVTMCVREEQPLIVNRQIRLVDPSTKKGTDIVWRFTEKGERVRVSKETGRVIPLPVGATMLEDQVIPSLYSEGAKDTKKTELTRTTFKAKLCTFEQDIMESMGIKEDRKPAKTYWY